MSFKDYLPAFVVAGYALAGLLGWLRGKIGFRGQKPVTVAIWVLVVATSLFWLVAGAGLTGTITVLAIFVVLPFAVIFVSQVLGRARRRRAGDENLAPIWPAVLLAIGALAFCVPAANLILNGLCSLVGLDHKRRSAGHRHRGHQRLRGRRTPHGQRRVPARRRPGVRGPVLVVRVRAFARGR